MFERAANTPGSDSCFECRSRNVGISDWKLADEGTFSKRFFPVTWTLTPPGNISSKGQFRSILTAKYKYYIWNGERQIHAAFLATLPVFLEQYPDLNPTQTVQSMEVADDDNPSINPPLEPVTKKLQLQTRGRVFGVIRESYLRWVIGKIYLLSTIQSKFCQKTVL